MTSLISVSDLTDYNITIGANEATLVNRLIASASKAVVSAAGSPILRATTTVTLLATGGRLLRLPGQPIQSVQSATVGGTNILGASADGLVPPGNCVLSNGSLYRPGGWALQGPEQVVITYTHGLLTVPEDIAELVVSVVLAGLTAARDGDDGLAMTNGRISSTAIDDFKEAYATGNDVESVTATMLPKRTREWLASRFGGGAQVVTTL